MVTACVFHDQASQKAHQRLARLFWERLPLGQRVAVDARWGEQIELSRGASSLLKRTATSHENLPDSDPERFSLRRRSGHSVV